MKNHMFASNYLATQEGHNITRFKSSKIYELGAQILHENVLTKMWRRKRPWKQTYRWNRQKERSWEFLLRKGTQRNSLTIFLVLFQKENLKAESVMIFIIPMPIGWSSWTHDFKLWITDGDMRTFLKWCGKSSHILMWCSSKGFKEKQDLQNPGKYCPRAHPKCTCIGHRVEWNCAIIWSYPWAKCIQKVTTIIWLCKSIHEVDY